MEKKDTDYLDHLRCRILELVALPVSKDKYDSVDNLICRYTSELRNSIDGKSNIDIEREFKHYVKNILSIVETLMSGEQYKALRRLIQNEIYSCAKVLMGGKTEKQ